MSISPELVEETELQDALNELLAQEWVDPTVYRAASNFAKIVTFLGRAGEIKIGSHGPKSVVFDWRVDADTARYVTVSEQFVSLLETTRLGITQRDELRFQLGVEVSSQLESST